MNARRRSQFVFLFTLAMVCGASGLLARCVDPEPAFVRSAR